MNKNKLNQYVVFKLGKEIYAINIEYIVRILSDEKIRSVPNTSGEIKGIIHTEEDIAPVMDLRVKFNIKSEKKEQIPFIIICRVQTDYVVGLIVDEVIEVIEIPDEEKQIKDLKLGTNTMSSKSTEYIQGIYRPNRDKHDEEDKQDELFIVLNVNKLLGLESLEELNQLKESAND